MTHVTDLLEAIYFVEKPHVYVGARTIVDFYQINAQNTVYGT